MDQDTYSAVTAKYYDAAYGTLRPGDDIGFYRDLAEELGGPVLELGCGTGRVLLEIADTGIPTVGLDQSPDMLSVLRAKLGVRPVRLVTGSMQTFDMPDRFQLILIAFRGFQHLLTVDEQLACLRAVRRHLKPHGVLALDVFNPQLARVAILEEPEAPDLPFQEGGDTIVRYTSIVRDPGVQVARVTMRYERSRDGAVVANEVSRFGMRWTYRFELEHLIRRAGFRTVEIFGDFNRSAFDADSSELVVLARD